MCLTAADDTDEWREATQKYIDDFRDDTGWTPRLTTTFAGALQYLEYDFATRLLMRRLMRRMHHPTDTKRDFDYTDWDAVDEFAHKWAPLAIGAVSAGERLALHTPGKDAVPRAIADSAQLGHPTP